MVALRSVDDVVVVYNAVLIPELVFMLVLVRDSYKHIDIWPDFPQITNMKHYIFHALFEADSDGDSDCFELPLGVSLEVEICENQLFLVLVGPDENF
jgi:hypothetical protein